MNYDTALKDKKNEENKYNVRLKNLRWCEKTKADVDKTYAEMEKNESRNQRV